MNFLVGLGVVVTILLGANFCFLLVGADNLERIKFNWYSPSSSSSKSLTVERFAVAVCTSTLGVTWLVAWIYFMTIGWDSFSGRALNLLPHIIIQLTTGLLLLIAGIAVFMKWRQSQTLFFAAISWLTFSVGFSMIYYGAQGHGQPLFMYLLATWSLAVGGLLAGAAFLLDRLMHGWDSQRRKPQNKKAKTMANSYSHE